MIITVAAHHQHSRLSKESSPLLSLSKPPVGTEDRAENHYSSTEVGRVNCELARTFSFGPYQPIPSQRLLLAGEKPLRLGSRALDILIALVVRRGELVGKEELLVLV